MKFHRVEIACPISFVGAQKKLVKRVKLLLDKTYTISRG